MNIQSVTVAVIIFLSALSSVDAALAEGHTEKGTNYGDHGVDTYARTRHGVDGRLFLDPYFLPFIQETEGQVFLDAGCGAGPWAIVAADHGAKVYGIDIQEKMIERAKIAAIAANVQDATEFEVGDVGALPYPSNFFDKAISLNVGCNLPLLEPHIKELKRVLKRGGSALITAPSSFEVVFTTGSQLRGKIVDDINKLLLGNTQDDFPASIQELDAVNRATFIKRDGKWVLVLSEEELLPGENIWRKIPKMIVPNRYHSEQEYLSLFEAEGFRLKSIVRPKFASEEEWQEYNRDHRDSLGIEYVKSSPFVIFVIEK